MHTLRVLRATEPGRPLPGKCFNFITVLRYGMSNKINVCRNKWSFRRKILVRLQIPPAEVALGLRFALEVAIGVCTLNKLHL